MLEDTPGSSPGSVVREEGGLTYEVEALETGQRLALRAPVRRRGGPPHVS